MNNKSTYKYSIGIIGSPAFPEIEWSDEQLEKGLAIMEEGFADLYN